MDFLKTVLGEELYGQVESAVNTYNASDSNKDNQIKLANLNAGGYVSIEKYQTLETKSNGFQTQLNEANDTIKSYKDMDIEGIKQSAADWETKYNTDTKALQDQIADQERHFAAERFMDTQKIKSPLSRKAIMQDFMDQKLELKDGAFVGAEEYMKGVREKYPDEFEEEVRESEKKVFVRGTARTFKPTTKSESDAYLISKYGKNKYFKG